MLAEGSFWLGVFLLGLAPGVVFLRVARVGWTWPETLAAAPGISLGTVAACAYLGDLFGLPVNVLGILPTLAGLLILLWALRRLQAKAPRPEQKPDGLLAARRRHPPKPHPMLERAGPRLPGPYGRYLRAELRSRLGKTDARVLAPATWHWLLALGRVLWWRARCAMLRLTLLDPALTRLAPWLIFLAPPLIYALLLPFRAIPVLPPTVHDGLDHATWFRLILESQSVTSDEVMGCCAKDAVTVAYPWGFHAWTALLADFATLHPVETYRRALSLLPCVAPLSMYVFAARFLPKHWPAMAAAWMAPAFFWLPFQPLAWGGHAIVAGSVCVLPLARATLRGLGPAGLSALALSAVTSVGVLLTHPSQALVAFIIAALLAIFCFVRGELSRRYFIAVVVTLLLVCLGLAFGADLWAPVEDFRNRALVLAQRLPSAGLATLGYWYRGLFRNDVSPMGYAIFFAAGAFAAIWYSRWRLFIIGHVLGLFLLLVSTQKTWLTMLWYHDHERLWYFHFAFIPVLVVLGLLLLINIVAWLPIPYTSRAQRKLWLWPVLLAIFMLGFNYQYPAFLEGRMKDHARGPMTFRIRQVLKDYEWIERNIPKNALIHNSPSEGGIVMIFTGRRTVFNAGHPGANNPAPLPRAYGQLKNPEHYGEDVHQRLVKGGVNYIYVATYAERTLDGNADYLPLEAVASNPSFEKIYGSETGHVFKINRYVAPDNLEW